RLPLGLGITIGCDHDDRNVGARGLRLRQQLQTAHPWHVDVGKDQNKRDLHRISDALKRSGGRLGKLHGKATGAQITSELLAKQHLNVRFIVDHDNKQAHDCAPDLASEAAPRRSVILNSVNSPGCVSISIDPECCLTTMSWLSERPSPVPSPAGLVVKKGLNIFSLTSGGIPVPLSGTLISTRSPRFFVAAASVGS